MEEEHKKLRKQRAIKVMITELLMFFSVILLVVFLSLIVLGYNFNIRKLGTEEVIERTGLIQISSTPSGATVMVDGEEGDLFSRTNYSKTLTIGEHSILLKRDGYDAWEKKINISEGLLFRVSYPRLFLKERKREDVLSFSEAELEMIKKLEFSEDGRYLILETAETVETTAEEEESAGIINTKKIDLNEGKPVLKDVKASELEAEEKIKAEEAVKLEKKLSELREKLELGKDEKILLGEYLGEEYIITYGRPEIKKIDVKGLKELEEDEVLEEEKKEGAETVKLYRGSDLESEVIKTVFRKEVEFRLKKIEIRGKGQLIFIYGETEEGEEKEIYYDFETGEFRENEVKAGEEWLDEYLKYYISDGKKIEICDFDGENRRTLVEEGEENEEIVGEFRIKISLNNKYLYYFVRNEAGVELVREKIL